MLSGETANSNFIDFGVTRPVVEQTIYLMQYEHAKHYTSDEVI